MPDVGKLQEILEAAGAEAGDFYLLEGRGRVLAALPAERAAFAKTLSLYRPQKTLARLWVRLIRILHGARLQGLPLKTWSWRGAQQRSLPCPGVLSGNPDHAVARAVFLLREKDVWVVGKFIPDPRHQEIVRREEDLLHLASHAGGHAPECLGWKPCGQGGALWTRWIQPRSGNPSRRDRLQILQDWLLEKTPRPLTGFPAWKTTGPGEKTPAHVAANLRLRPSLRHGDFAPWNLLKNPSGTWVAVDWEEGCAEDAPGLDLVHDLVQEEFLIRRAPFGKAMVRIQKILQEPKVANYLSACGWSGNESFLFHWATAFESAHRPEIKRWVNAR